MDKKILQSGPFDLQGGKTVAMPGDDLGRQVRPGRGWVSRGRRWQKIALGLRAWWPLMAAHVR